MMHCPLCRFALDRYNLRDEMSFNVSVARLRLTSVRCNNFRMGFLSGFHTHGDPNAKIITGGCNATASEPVSRVASKLVQGCFAMKAEDGFVYNVSLLALDRAVSHHSQSAISTSEPAQSGGLGMDTRVHSGQPGLPHRGVDTNEAWV